MSYTDRAAEHRRVWNERADTAERLATAQPEFRTFLRKAARDARRCARRPYWLVWAWELFGHWAAPLVMTAALWIWWLTAVDYSGRWFWVFATGYTLLMGGFAFTGYRLARRRERDRRLLQERFQDRAADSGRSDGRSDPARTTTGAPNGLSSTAFTCPRCKRTSYNPNDAREGYCGACHDFTGPTSGNSRTRKRTR
jgi:hypothetical protein